MSSYTLLRAIFMLQKTLLRQICLKKTFILPLSAKNQHASYVTEIAIKLKTVMLALTYLKPVIPLKISRDDVSLFFPSLLSLTNSINSTVKQNLPREKLRQSTSVRILSENRTYSGMSVGKTYFPSRHSSQERLEFNRKKLGLGRRDRPIYHIYSRSVCGEKD